MVSVVAHTHAFCIGTHTHRLQREREREGSWGVYLSLLNTVCRYLALLTAAQLTHWWWGHSWPYRCLCEPEPTGSLSVCLEESRFFCPGEEGSDPFWNLNNSTGSYNKIVSYARHLNSCWILYWEPVKEACPLQHGCQIKPRTSSRRPRWRRIACLLRPIVSNPIICNHNHSKISNILEAAKDTFPIYLRL